MTIQLPQDVECALDALAAKNHQSSEQIVVDAVREYLSEQQDAEIAVERLREIREGKTYTVSLAEVMDRYGVEH